MWVCGLAPMEGESSLRLILADMAAMSIPTSARSPLGRNRHPAPQLTSEERATPSTTAGRRLAQAKAHEQNWVKRIDLDGKVTGIFADYHYVGTGDIGGATQESTVKLLEAIVTKSETVLPTPPHAHSRWEKRRRRSRRCPSQSRRRPSTCCRVRRRSNLQRHHTGNVRTAAAVQGRPGTDQPLRWFTDFAGVS